MWQNKKVSVVLPAYNEEENIRRAVEDFSLEGIVDEIIVIDNNSRDKTAEEVRKTKAILIKEEKQGYGYALQRGMREASGDIIITSEPDGTFWGKDVLKLLAYADDFDVVLGTRTTSEMVWEGANMGFFLKWGNWAVAKLLEILFNGPSLTDVGCTMKLFHRRAVDKIIEKFTVGGSHFSPEVMILPLLYKLKTIEIPLNYGMRKGTSKITGSRWRTIQVGMQMILLIFKYRIKSLFVKV